MKKRQRVADRDSFSPLECSVLMRVSLPNVIAEIKRGLLSARLFGTHYRISRFAVIGWCIENGRPLGLLDPRPRKR